MDPARGGTGRAAEEEEREPQVPAPDFVGPSGVPYVPAAGIPPGTYGFFLDLALLAEVRARSLEVTDAGTTWGWDMEVTPGIALQARTPRLTLSLGYAPRLSVPFDAENATLAILHRATARIEWAASPTWRLSALGLFVVGDYSQLVPATTPGGPGPTPPVYNPVRSFVVYPYVGIDTLAVAEGTLAPRLRLRLAGGYFDVGGLGVEGEAAQPRAWGPQAEAALSVDTGPTTTFSSWVEGRSWILTSSEYFVLATITERWTQRWSDSVDTTLTLGVGLSNRDVESSTAARHLVPVARVALAWRTTSRQPLTLTVDAALWPYMDTYAGFPYQRVTGAAALDWQLAPAWRLRLSLDAAYVPNVLQAPASYGSGGLSASYSPVPFLTLSLGGFALLQFQGVGASEGGFAQWTGWFSIAMTDRLSL